MKKLRLQLRLVLPILIGTAIYAFGLHYFVLPNQLMEGGVTGIAVLLNYAAGWPLSLSTLALNVPLFLLGWKTLGRGQMMYTFIGVVSLSAFLALMERLIALHWLIPFQSKQDYMLAALYAGVSLGTGLGIVFRFGGTTGGVDIIRASLHAPEESAWANYFDAGCGYYRRIAALHYHREGTVYARYCLYCIQADRFHSRRRILCQSLLHHYR